MIIRRTYTPTIRKLEDGSLEFVLSDETRDRYGDIIMAAGWSLGNFRRNPIALFNHSNMFPIGTWEKVRVEGNRLIGVLRLAAEGTSERIDELIRLVSQGILRAVSVGFIAKKREPLDPDKPYGGQRYLQQELLECSLVSVPANPSAVQLARSMNVSEEVIGLAFGEPAVQVQDLSATTANLGELAVRSMTTSQGRTQSMTLAERIAAARRNLATLQEDLTRHIEGMGDQPSADLQTQMTEKTTAVGNAKAHLDMLLQAERALATTTATQHDNDGSVTIIPPTPTADQRAVIGHNGGPSLVPVDHRAPFAAPAQKLQPVDFIIRSLAIATVSHTLKLTHTDAMKRLYGEDVVTKTIMEIVLRAASVPADTATPAWAGALVQTAIGDFFELLMPSSVYPQLSQVGGRFSFGRNGIVSLPTRAATPTVAGSFVGEGAPIPVRQAGFSAVSLTPKKMAVITTMTREITEHSTPNIEAILRQAIQEDTSVAVDSVLLDNGAATTVRPAGLRNGASTAAGEAGGGFAALVADVKNMVSALITNTGGNIRNPVWIMNPVQALSISLTQNAGGDFPFRAEINQNRFANFPLIQSTTQTLGRVMLVDAADFFSATGDEPRFAVSDQATLHMEDTTPAAIGTTGTPNVVAAPVRSMFQTDTLALRMILPMNWALRRTGVVVERTAVSW